MINGGIPEYRGETMNSMRSIRTLLCDSRYRVRLLKAGFTGKEIEYIHLYLLSDNVEVVGVNWCNCKKCKSGWGDSEDIKNSNVNIYI